MLPGTNGAVWISIGVGVGLFVAAIVTAVAVFRSSASLLCLRASLCSDLNGELHEELHARLYGGGLHSSGT